MRFGVEQNLRVKSARTDVGIAGQAYTASLGAWAPEVEAYADGGKHFGRSVDPRTNAYTSAAFLESNLGLNVSWPLFEGFMRVNRAEFEKLNLSISRLDAETTANRVAFEIMTACFGLFLEDRLLELAREQYRLSEQYKHRTEVLLETGRSSKADMQEMEARLKSDLYQLTYRENSRSMALLHLKQLLNLPASGSVSVGRPADDVLLPVAAELSADSLFRTTLHVLPEGRIPDLKIEAARRKLAIAKGRFAPTVRAEYALATGFYNTERRDDGTVIPFSSQLGNNLNHYVGIRIAFPLFSGLKRYTAWRTERLNLRKTETEADREKQRLRADVETACLALQAAAKEYDRACEQVRAEEINLHVFQRKWEEGLVSLFELIEVRNRCIAARAEQTRTQLQYTLQQKTIRFYETGTFF